MHISCYNNEIMNHSGIFQQTKKVSRGSIEYKCIEYINVECCIVMLILYSTLSRSFAFPFQATVSIIFMDANMK